MHFVLWKKQTIKHSERKKYIKKEDTHTHKKKHNNFYLKKKNVCQRIFFENQTKRKEKEKKKKIEYIFELPKEIF